jgi:hypothetical protein
MARSKALAIRDYVRKPAVQPSKPTKRITPELVAESPDTEPYSSQPEPQSEPEPEEPEVPETLGTTSNPILWEPSCTSEDHDYEHNAEYLQELYNERLHVDNDLLKPLYNMGHTKAAACVITPILRYPCGALSIMVEAYCRNDFDGRLQAGLCALVFYRRHSYQLDPLLTQTEVDFFEGMCNYLLCFLRNAGYHVTHTGEPSRPQ